MMMVRCYLAPSAIEGLGVFCHDNITKGDIVWRHDKMLDTTFPESKLDNVEPHMKEFLERYSFPDPCRPGYLILQCDEGRFLNHSMYPNLDFSDGVWGRALASIPAGTELTFDYADFLTGEIRMQPPRHQVHMMAMAAE
ncbi:SET domain-containing protein [Leisingera sp. McT4-56]|uniref:SET domain-containing protein n=1 Tax=Leisingera sp. McT4-56 TaxID=2881255 RepID=UPI001CF91160|nr:SET domain-containing protein [Leisingera sp. McT4-56]MCB4455532.1 SET domain-containing protein [Leisingera sp. McT4-56]